MSAGSIGITRRLVRDPAIARTGQPFPVIEGFVLFEFACQLALLSASLGGLRVLLRCAAFGMSLLLIVLSPPGRNTHPALKPLLAAIVLLFLALFNPHSNTMLSGVMQVALYIAIMAPLLWVSNLPIGKEQVRRILLIMLVFQATSSLVGILQVYYPGSFRGSTSSVIVAAGRHYLKGLYYKNASGVLVLRPSGLTDVPGGVGMAGQYAALFGLYFFFTERRQLMRVTAAAATMMGVMAVYLSGVKAAMICLVLGLASFGIFLSWSDVSQRARGMAVWFAQRRGSPIQVLVLILGISVGGFFVARNIGGEGVTSATETLTQSTPTQLFYQERGQFLEYTLNVLLPQYPFGGGLGRWGMMSYYFGDPHDSNSVPIWVEIQWTAWLIDGGVPLVLAYAFALFVAVQLAARTAVSGLHGEIGALAALVAAYDIGVLAGTFDYVPFISTMGMDFWLLNALLFVVIVQSYRTSGRPAGTANEARAARFR
jgi:hypothetical protein